MRRLNLALPLLFILGSLFVLHNQATADRAAKFTGNLNVQVTGMKSQSGLLCIKVFNGSQGFPDSNEKAQKRDCVKITEDPMKFTYRGLTAGSYAVAVFHDANSDRQLNRNSAGMPTEGYGFSNNPVIKQGPPKFGQTVFLVAGPNTGVRIQMKYFTGN